MIAMSGSAFLVDISRSWLTSRVVGFCAGNYGTTMVPLDKLFGTYEDGSKWAAKEEAAKAKAQEKADAAAATTTKTK